VESWYFYNLQNRATGITKSNERLELAIGAAN